MKNWRKATLVTGGAMIVAGLGLTAVGAAVGVKSIYFNDLYNYEYAVPEFDGDYGMNASWGNNANQTEVVMKNSGDRKSASYKLEPFDTLEIDMDVGIVEIVEGEGWNLQTKNVIAKNFTYDNQGGNLQINYKANKNFMNFMNRDNWNKLKQKEGILITVPKGTKLERIYCELGVGETTIRDMTINEAQIFAGLGTTMIENCTMQNLEVDGGVGETMAEGLKVTHYMKLNASVGQISMDGEFKGEVKIDGGVGSVVLNMNNCTEADYNYEVDQGVGSVKIGGEAKDALGGSWSKNTDTAKNYIDVEGGVGEITINFNR